MDVADTPLGLDENFLQRGVAGSVLRNWLPTRDDYLWHAVSAAALASRGKTRPDLASVFDALAG